MYSSFSLGSCSRGGKRQVQSSDPDQFRHIDFPSYHELQSTDSNRVGSGGTMSLRHGKHLNLYEPVLESEAASNEASAQRVQVDAVDDKETPSSTPLPPPLKVPIVTHTMGQTKGIAH